MLGGPEPPDSIIIDFGKKKNFICIYIFPKYVSWIEVTEGWVPLQVLLLQILQVT
jgi:hypothetical protein